MRIGELATAAGVSAKTVRYYEAEGLVPEPRRTPSGYRDFDAADVDRVVFVKQAQAAGLTLRQIGEVLAIRDGGRPPCAHVARLVDARLAEVEHRLRMLRDTRRRLVEVRERLDGLDPADCPPDSICAAISQTGEETASSNSGI
jgi:DNA-binding transcriptional MerR regulator